MHPLPDVGTCTLIFKVRYAKPDSIFYLGIIDEKLKWQHGNTVPYELGAISYLTKNEQKVGWIYADGNIVAGEKGKGSPEVFI